MAICNTNDFGAQLTSILDEVNGALKEIKAMQDGSESKTYDGIKRRILNDLHVNTSEFGSPVLKENDQ